MRDNKYKNLVEDGEFLYKGMQKKDVNLNFTAEQYSKPAHFIYEIIQNANDAKAFTYSGQTITCDGDLIPEITIDNNNNINCN